MKSIYVVTRVFWGCLLVSLASALYEDQAFKMDWHLKSLDSAVGGEIVKKNFILYSESGVLASISTRDGSLNWRQVLEPSLKFLDMDEYDEKIRLLLMRDEGLILRTWNPEDGSLIDEDIYRENCASAFIVPNSQKIALIRENSLILDGNSIPLPSGLPCSKAYDFVVCPTDSISSFLLDLTRLGQGFIEKSSFTNKELNAVNRVRALSGTYVSSENQVHPFGESYLTPNPCGLSDELIYLDKHCDNNNCAIESNPQGILDLKYEYDRGDMKRIWSFCENSQIKIIIQLKDGSLVGEGWTRNDGLGNIKDVHFLPFLSDVQASNGNENKESFHALKKFVNRLKRHVLILKNKLENILHPEVNDFGTRKVIVALTTYGKVYGLDSKNGKILWQIMFGGKKETSDEMLFVQRGDRNPLVTLLFWDGIQRSLSFNPVSGEIISLRDYGDIKVIQASSLHFVLSDDLRPIMMIKENGNVELEPSSALERFTQEAVKNKVFVMRRVGDGELQGNRVDININGYAELSKTWSVSLPSSFISKVIPKHLDNRVHSQGRVMADRSVLFKYVNPNLAAVLAESVDLTSITLLLLDMVTGRILFSLSHKRVSGPYCLIHSENWVVYSYYNEKSRRTEVGSLELFEGNTQMNDTVFSSFQNTRSPLVERQSYILGNLHIATMGETTTEKGITSKHLLLATSQGLVYNVPRGLLDPRRPNANTPPENREPGLMPYTPELNLSPKFVLNYNRTLISPKGVLTAHTGLESTSVIFVYGLDLYCTQVHPSKGFDLLKDDFDYYVISTVLMGLVVAAGVTRKLAQNKNVKQAWK